MYKPKYYDVGVNLTDHMFSGKYRGRYHHRPDLQNVLLKAKRYGVQKMLVTGSSLQESATTIDIISKYKSIEYPEMYCTVGVHPCTVMEFEKDEADHINKLRTLIKSGIEAGYVHAFGEIGLDYDRLHFSPLEKQKYYFNLQLQLACEFDLPLFLHMRSACEDFIGILKPFLTGENGYLLQNRSLLIHSFTGSNKELNSLLELDQINGSKVYFSINGAGLRESESLNVIKSIPLNKLMIETDSPWCEIKRTHPSWKFISKAPNTFYPIEYNEVVNEELMSLAKASKLNLNEFLPIPTVKSDKFDKFTHSDKFIDSPLIKSRNEPCLIGFVAEVISKVCNYDPETLVKTCYANSQKVFG